MHRFNMFNAEEPNPWTWKVWTKIQREKNTLKQLISMAHPHLHGHSHAGHNHGHCQGDEYHSHNNNVNVMKNHSHSHPETSLDKCVTDSEEQAQLNSCTLV